MSMGTGTTAHARRVAFECYVAALGGNVANIDLVVPPEAWEKPERAVKVKMPAGHTVEIGQEHARRAILQNGGVLVTD